MTQSNNDLMNRFIFFSLLLFGLIFSSSAQTFKKVNIIIAHDSIDELESHPFSNDDVHGDIEIDGQRFSRVELHYRGAYYLSQLLRKGSIRNWKVKFSKENKFENRREWNFNSELFIRQKLSYDLFKKAGIPVVSAENVLLFVNGNSQGLYLKYEDPDNKDWLKDVFGDNDGDLYKAAYDIPGEPSFFADFTYLGPNSSDYFFHYRKQTNKKGDGALDYSSIREFTHFIDQSSSAEFEQGIEEKFDVQEFIRYLVISNFIANWDSYPFRPKNFSLYQSPQDGKWHYIPWDLDGTFQVKKGKNTIGTTGSIFHYFDRAEPYGNSPREPVTRPLLWNIMKIDRYREDYCLQYNDALNTFLSKKELFGQIARITDGVASNISGSHLSDYNIDTDNVKSFIRKRIINVQSEVEQCISNIEVKVLNVDNQVQDHFEGLKIYPNPASNVVTIQFDQAIDKSATLEILNLLGQTVLSTNITAAVDQTFVLSTENLQQGKYIVIVKSKTHLFSTKLEIK